mmetsp:Transcript_32926/g.79659  ORF Transcript_32926/g.79659 Transcript_32926/m.79659 type:complete len:160 (+) Transcript_32926:28-507(+)|eukprot:CAMPEP_0113605218 /NCGR_PEP_ID=MMETSP0017_2-20120614/2211_1 /TAXON_ID=2856 /ORGANISM="Cylindrotheca closterium" /LENGTH=159 /DNA_ID=CAMNT_0000513695 /DNA_START=28 /DNA_END=507 /DNA_ORIENTATION=+ /assembly_acc=CAM_ASM_000147
MRDDHRVHHQVMYNPVMYNPHAEQMNYHLEVPIYRLDDDLSPTQGMGMDKNERGATTTSVPDSQAQLHILQLEFEVAIDEQLQLLRENKILKAISCEKRVTEIEREYKDLSMESELLLADVERKRKEVKACERIIQILQGEITKANVQNMVDLTHHPDF